MIELLNNDSVRKKTFKIIVLVVISVFLVFCIFPPNVVMNFIPFYHDKMIQDTVEWCRIDDFPVQGIEIEVKGSVFSREYVGSFIASKELVDVWVENSPGLQNAKTEILSKGVIKYIITPGGGAQYAEVVIDFEYGKVTFRTYWS